MDDIENTRHFLNFVDNYPLDLRPESSHLFRKQRGILEQSILGVWIEKIDPKGFFRREQLSQ